MPKEESESELLVRLTERARGRYERRRAATDWFWAFTKDRWRENPKLITRVASNVARGVPALASSPRRHRYICYEDCVHLEEEALILLTRLAHWRSTAAELT